jgi:hypothetical protein
MSDFLAGMAGPFVGLWNWVGAYRIGYTISVLCAVGFVWVVVRAVTKQHKEEDEGQ